MNVFIIDEIIGDTAVLRGEEAHHCIKVLRKRSNEIINLMDGKGFFYSGRIAESTKNEVFIDIIDIKKEESRPYKLNMAVAITKNSSRFEWFVEKAVEIGVDAIIPLVCEHSEKNRINTERLNRIARGAAKQSLTATIPEIRAITQLMDLLNNADNETLIAAYFESEQKHLKHVIVPNDSYTIIVGPEGDFSIKEVEEMKNKNCYFAVLGNKRLRTETAALVAVQIVSSIHF